MNPKIKQILKKYSLRNGVTVDDLLGHDRSLPLPIIRFEMYAEIKDTLKCSWCEMARDLHRDHSSIIYGYKKHKEGLSYADKRLIRG